MNVEKKIIKSLYPEGFMETDDCYLLGKQLFSTDVMAENTHFNLKWSSPAELAIKLTEVNISDILASGGLPSHAFLNLGFGAHDKDWLGGFSSALKKHLKKYRITLAGGDTFRSDKLYLGMTIVGDVVHYCPRENARAGEYLYLTGALGFSRLGFKFLKKNRYDNRRMTLASLEEYRMSPVIKNAVNRHLAPKSRYDLWQALLKNKIPAAAIDITDGLVQDAANLAHAAKSALHIELDKLPQRHKLDLYLPLSEQISSGEELEILFSSKRNDLHNHYDVSQIGQVKKGKGVKFTLNGKSYRPDDRGFLHFD